MSDSILGVPIPVFGATGPRYSGKTILGASLAPGVFPDGHPHAGKHRTLILDLEASSETYELPAQRVDVPGELRKKHGASAYRQVDVFEWFRDLYQTIPVGRFDVIMVDPITDIEGGGVIWAREHPQEFGYTAGQFSKMEAIAIDCAKKLWKSICLDIATRCQTFYFTTHERMIWEGGRPVKGKTQPKGMDYLFECSSLYLKLGREPDIEGEAPKPPFAEVLKSRLAFTSVGKDGELDICEILPKRLPVATKAAIVKYVKHPVGKRTKGLTADEIVREKDLSDDEKLMIQQEIAANKAQAATAELSALEIARAAAAQAAASFGAQQAAPQPAQQPVPQQEASQTTKPMATAQQQAEMVGLMRELFSSGPKAQEWLLENASTNSPAELTETEAMGVLSALLLLKHQMQTPPPPPPEPEQTQQPPGAVTQQQRDRIRELTLSLWPQGASEQQAAWLRSLGYGSAQSLTFAQAADRIAELERLAAPRAETYETPF